MQKLKHRKNKHLKYGAEEKTKKENEIKAKTDSNILETDERKAAEKTWRVSQQIGQLTDPPEIQMKRKKRRNN